MKMMPRQKNQCLKPTAKVKGMFVCNKKCKLVLDRFRPACNCQLSQQGELK